MTRMHEDVDLLNETGVGVWREGRRSEAAEIFRHALAIKPDDSRIWTNLGLVLAEQDLKAEAIESYRTALRLEPNLFDPRMNLGIALSDLGNFEEAMNWLLAALELRPDSAEALQNVGMNLSRQARWGEAIAYYERAARLQPENPEVHRSLAYVLLGAGDYTRGWPEHEWRLSCRPLRGVQINRTFWNGDDFRNQTILLHYEQGYGDTLQFIRFAPLVKRRGGRVAMLCQPDLLRLVARCPGIDLVFEGTSYEPECHIHAPVMSLPAIFGTTLATLPAEVPYLFADRALVEYWRSELGRALTLEAARDLHVHDRSDPGRPFLIGIAWQGRPEHDGDRWRSFALAQFAPLAELPGVRLISLQVGDGRDQVQEIDGRFPVIDLPRRRGRDFSETAAIMCSLDLVISPDSAVAHLAGGLGIPVWVALPYSCDWRWLSGRDDSPWYPTMRLFRQSKPAEWGPVFQRMGDALKRMLGRQAA